MSTISWSFTTGTAQANCPCTIWPATATPMLAADADTRSIEVGVKFRSDVSGFITGLRFYKGKQQCRHARGHAVELRPACALARATFTGETGSGWQQINFTTPVAVNAGTTYVASYHANNGRYAGDNDFFAGDGVHNAPLHALRNGVDGANGVYIYNATPTFPTQTFRRQITGSTWCSTPRCGQQQHDLAGLCHADRGSRWRYQIDRSRRKVPRRRQRQHHRHSLLQIEHQHRHACSELVADRWDATRSGYVHQ